MSLMGESLLVCIYLILNSGNRNYTRKHSIQFYLYKAKPQQQSPQGNLYCKTETYNNAEKIMRNIRHQMHKGNTIKIIDIVLYQWI